MNIEEAKAFLEANGYSVIKKNPLPKLLPCVCGCKRRTEVMVGITRGDAGRVWGTMYRCERCGFEGGFGKTNRDAREEWNNAVIDAKVVE